MPVIDVTPDLDARTITINAEFAPPVERVWQIYADPRQLEKIWGPPTIPRPSSNTNSSRAERSPTT